MLQNNQASASSMTDNSNPTDDSSYIEKTRSTMTTTLYDISPLSADHAVEIYKNAG